MKRNILIIFVHPAPRRSRYNSRLLAAARGLEYVAVRDLYELYPDFHINVAAEQAALEAADAIVFQFPIYWYSAPALLREWQDEVLTMGFAYGRDGLALRGKPCLYAIGAGGCPRAYTAEGPHGAPLDTYLKPFEQTAIFCGMRLVDPFIIQGVVDLTEQQLDDVARRYCDRLIQLAEEV